MELESSLRILELSLQRSDISSVEREFKLAVLEPKLLSCDVSIYFSFNCSSADWSKVSSGGDVMSLLIRCLTHCDVKRASLSSSQQRSIVSTIAVNAYKNKIENDITIDSGWSHFTISEVVMFITRIFKRFD